MSLVICIFDNFQANSSAQGGPENEEISLKISPGYIIFFVFMMCGMLVMLYFFFDYLGKAISKCTAQFYSVVFS